MPATETATETGSAAWPPGGSVAHRSSGRALQQRPAQAWLAKATHGLHLLFLRPAIPAGSKVHVFNHLNAMCRQRAVTTGMGQNTHTWTTGPAAASSETELRLPAL